MAKNIITSPKKRALSAPITCPICEVTLSPPVPHSCGGILEDLSAISEYLSTGDTMPSARRYFGHERVA